MAFLDGIRVYSPNDNAPDFVKANLVINVAELRDFLNKQDRTQIRANLKQSKAGNLYLEVDEYQKSDTPF